MFFGSLTHARRNGTGIGLIDFSGRPDIAPVYWSRTERACGRAQHGMLIEEEATILGTSVEDLFIAAAHFPLDMLRDGAKVARAYRRWRAVEGG